MSPFAQAPCIPFPFNAVQSKDEKNPWQQKKTEWNSFSKLILPSVFAGVSSPWHFFFFFFFWILVLRKFRKITALSHPCICILMLIPGMAQEQKQFSLKINLGVQGGSPPWRGKGAAPLAGVRGQRPLTLKKFWNLHLKNSLFCDIKSVLSCSFLPPDNGEFNQYNH